MTGAILDPGPLPRISGPEMFPRDSRDPPTFTIADDAPRFFGVEVASAPELLSANAGRTADTYYSSWSTGGELRALSAETLQSTFTLPLEAWQRLRTAERLYFRATTSASPSSWVDTRRSSRQDALPFVTLTGRFEHTGREPHRTEELLWRVDPT